MANAVYPLYKQALKQGATLVSLHVNDATDGPFCALIDTGAYTYNVAHQFYNASLTGKVGTDQRIVNPTVSTTGLFDGDNLTYTSVTGASIEALVIYRHNSGADTTWKLALYIDDGGGISVTPNGGNITVTWSGSGIYL